MWTKRLLYVLVAAIMIAGVGMVLANGGDVTQSQSYDKASGHPGAGAVNYSTQVVEATGIGVINPKAVNVGQARAGCVTAAKVTAQRNLLEIIQGVNVDSETTVKNNMLEDDTIKTKVSGVLKGARQKPGSPKYLDDASCEVTLFVVISGALSDALLPPPADFGGNPPPAGPQKVYTGLIIDATGLSAVPAMAPKVLDEGGAEVYGTESVSREFAVKQGVVGYAKSVEQAKSITDRVGANPLILKAVSAKGESAKTDVVISAADAAKMKDAQIDWTFLKECRVIIVL